MQRLFYASLIQAFICGVASAFVEHAAVPEYRAIEFPTLALVQIENKVQLKKPRWALVQIENKVQLKKPRWLDRALQKVRQSVKDPEAKYLKQQWDQCSVKNGMIAVVFNMDKNTDRWNYIQGALLALNICPARFPACTPENTEDVKTLNSLGGVQVKRGTVHRCRGVDVAGSLEWKPTVYLHNGLTQLKAWNVAKQFIGDKGWMLFFEDDATVHPSLSGVDMAHIIRDSLDTSMASSHGIAHFGLCSPSCEPGQQVLFRTYSGSASSLDLANITYAKCTGACAHAYAMSKGMLRAVDNQRLLSLERLQTSDEKFNVPPAPCPREVGCVHDPFGAHSLLTQSCTGFSDQWQLPSCGNLYGSNLNSPCHGKHNGLFFQDRKVFTSDMREDICR